MRWCDLKKQSRILRYLRRIKKRRRSTFKKIVVEASEDYCNYYPDADRNKMIEQMFKLFRKYGVTPGEYVDFRLYGKKDKEIKEYVYLDEISRVFSNGKRNIFPKSKFSRYELFHDFFRREIIQISDESEEIKYKEFISDKKKIMVKPIRGDKGKGVEAVDTERFQNLSKLSESFHFPVLLEEYIRQGEELARFHPGSINTVRIVSAINKKHEPVIVYALFRCGQGNAVVDNVGSGGLIMLVNEKDGVICTDALFNHNYYEKHPDSGHVFRGTRIPEWQRVLDIVTKAHGTMRQQALIGWDFAWTAKGWDLVEANPAPSFASWQTLTGRGIRSLLKELGII